MKELIVLMTLVIISFTSNTQTLIAIEDFDGGTPNFSFTTIGGATVTNSSVAADRPASSTFYTSAITAYSATNSSSTLTSANVNGLATYTNKFVDFRLASWSLGSTGNGADGTDNVIVEISLDGGTTFSSEVQVNGNTNAYWHYSTGTANATVTYDGNNTPTVFAPTAGGNRTADGYSTVRVDLPNSATQVIIRIRLFNDNTAERWTIDNIRLFGTLSTPCVVGAAPTTNASNALFNPFCNSSGISFTPGNGTNRIVVASTNPVVGSPTNATSYSANTTLGSGSTIAPGEFVVFNGSGSNFTLTGLSSNTTYYIRVFEYNAMSANCDESYQTVGTLSGNFTTLNNCNTPQIRSLLADACSTQEGLNELVLIENGSNALNINDITLAFPSGGTYCNTTCGANTLGNNPGYITQLNTMAGCALFTYADPIPAGATIVVFTGQTPSYVFDYSSQCPTTEVFYAVFCNNTSTAGRFANSGTGTRTLNATFAGVSESVTYAPSSLGGDGSFVDFDDAGNPTYRTEANCIYPLGVTLINWNAAKDQQKVFLNWSTILEKEAASFEIIRSTYESEQIIGTVQAVGNSTERNDYTFIDYHPFKGINYYQLKQVDRNQNASYSNFIAVNFNNDQQVIRSQNNILSFSEVLVSGESIQIISAQGQQLLQKAIDVKTSTIELVLSSGVYIAYIQHRDGTTDLIRFFVSNEK